MIVGARDVRGVLEWATEAADGAPLELFTQASATSPRLRLRGEGRPTDVRVDVPLLSS